MTPPALEEIELGVATSSFQCEGGLDGSSQPETNWAAWQRYGKVERIGAASGLWERYPEAARRCASLGLRAFRLSIEWARVCPEGEAPQEQRLEEYAERIAYLLDCGITPIVTLSHFTHPAWAGADLWLDSASPLLFSRYASMVSLGLGKALIRRGYQPLRRFVTINEPNMLALASYAAGVFPHGVGALGEGDFRGGARALACLDRLLSAHVRAHKAVHQVYEAQGWGAVELTTNINFIDVYGACGWLVAILRARELEIAGAGLKAYATRDREQFYKGFFGSERGPRVEAARALDALWSWAIGPEVFEQTLGVLGTLPKGQRSLDSIAFDLYDPWSMQQLLGSGEPQNEAGLLLVVARKWRGAKLAEPWEWAVEPDCLPRALAALHRPGAPLLLDVLENGMSLQREKGKVAVARADGATRSGFIAGYLHALVNARRSGLPVRTWLYWTLVDNYELGRYAPRFGLYGLSDAPEAPWSWTDCAGNDAAGTLRAFATAMERAKVEPALLENLLRETSLGRETARTVIQ